MRIAFQNCLVLNLWEPTLRELRRISLWTKLSWLWLMDCWFQAALGNKCCAGINTLPCFPIWCIPSLQIVCGHKGFTALPYGYSSHSCWQLKQSMWMDATGSSSYQHSNFPTFWEGLLCGAKKSEIGSLGGEKGMLVFCLYPCEFYPMTKLVALLFEKSSSHSCFIPLSCSPWNNFFMVHLLKCNMQ